MTRLRSNLRQACWLNHALGVEVGFLPVRLGLNNAERRGLTRSAARWLRLSFPTLQRGNAVLDAPRRKRMRSVLKGMRRRASHDKF
ncbi:DUF1534 domain-containing protein [Pseudomonas syringae]|nr:DUF1534 domain-containing protein [Pseudomonas syringae]